MDDLIIYNTDDGQANVSLFAKDGTVWCTQAQMAELFNVQKAAISKHLKNLFEDGEVDKNSVVSTLETTAAERKSFDAEAADREGLEKLEQDAKWLAASKVSNKK